VAIEGPLRELSIHDVFSLLDLSRKTGALTVTSALRDNQGTVYFDRGGVVYAAIRSNPHPLGELLMRAGKASEGDVARARNHQQTHGDGRKLGEILVEMGAITWRELERQVRFQVEEVVFELMSWNEGYFSFEERSVSDAPAEASIRISTESLLMEGARRIDEWSRIEGKVPHLDVIPLLAAVREDHPTLLDLLPNEWEVLSEIDGGRDLRSIATNLARSEFDVAKIAYGLLTTGVIEIRDPAKVAKRSSNGNGVHATVDHLERALGALNTGAFEEAVKEARTAMSEGGATAEAHVVLARALGRLGRHTDAAEELRRAFALDPLHERVHCEMGYNAAARGSYLDALAGWERYLRMAPAAPDVPQVRSVMEATARLRLLLQDHMDV
jgi:tetratricopeptide (TPR) repeat protein